MSGVRVAQGVPIIAGVAQRQSVWLPTRRSRFQNSSPAPIIKMSDNRTIDRRLPSCLGITQVDSFRAPLNRPDSYYNPHVAQQVEAVDFFGSFIETATKNPFSIGSNPIMGTIYHDEKENGQCLSTIR